VPNPFDDRLSTRHWDLDRLTALTDNVFSVALTIQALSFVLSPNLDPGNFRVALRHELGGIPAYLIGFWNIAMMWRSHHRIFGFLRRQDPRLVFMNFAFLSVVCFIPFATNVLSDYGGGRQAPVLRREVEFPSVVLYSLTVALASLLVVAIWVYATRGRRLVDPDLDSRLVAHMTQRGLVVPAVFLASIPVALFRPLYAMVSWLAIVPLQWSVNRYWHQRLLREP